LGASSKRTPYKRKPIPLLSENKALEKVKKMEEKH